MGNCIRSISGEDALPGLTLIFAKTCFAIWIDFSFYMSSLFPLMSLSWMLIFVVSIDCFHNGAELRYFLCAFK